MGDGGALLLGLLLAVQHQRGRWARRPRHRRGRRADVLLPRPAVHPAVHPRRADPRHAVRHHPPGAPAAGAGHRRQGPPAPPADGARARAAPQRADPVVLDGAAVGVRALPGASPTAACRTCRSAPRCSGSSLYTLLHPQIRRKRSAGLSGLPPSARSAPGSSTRGTRRDDDRVDTQVRSVQPGQLRFRTTSRVALHCVRVHKLRRRGREHATRPG